MGVCDYINKLRVNYHINKSHTGTSSENVYHASLALDIAERSRSKKLIRFAKTALEDTILDE